MPRPISCQLRCGRLGNPQWHDLCAACFDEFALRPVLKASQSDARQLPVALADCSEAVVEDLDFTTQPWTETLPLTLLCLTSLEAAVFLLALILGGIAPLSENPLLGTSSALLYRLGGLFPQQGQWWRLVSGQFLHAGFLHLIPNLGLRWLVAEPLESCWGSWKCFEVVMVASSTGALLSAAVSGGAGGAGWLGAVSGRRLSASASSSLFGLAGARLIALPGQPFSGACLIHRIAWWLTATSVVLALAIGAFLPIIDTFGHIGGFVAGSAWAVLRLWPRHRSSAARLCFSLWIAVALLLLCFSIRGLYICSQDPGCGPPSSEFTLIF